MRIFLLVLMIFQFVFVKDTVVAQANPAVNSTRNMPNKVVIPPATRNMMKEEAVVRMQQEASGTPVLKEQSLERRQQLMLAHLSRIKKHLSELKKKIDALVKLDSEVKSSVTSVLDEHITWVEQQEAEVNNASAETLPDVIKNIRDVWNVRKDMVYFYAGLIHLNKAYMLYERTNTLYQKIALEDPESSALLQALTSLETAKTELNTAKEIWTSLEHEAKPSEITSANNRQIKLVFQSLRSVLTVLKESQPKPINQAELIAP